MRRILEDVIPIGTPWGGPESRRYLSSFVSMLMQVEQHTGTEQALRSTHERLYHHYLAVSGIGASTVWSEGLGPCSHEVVIEALIADYIERTMAYAGFQHSTVGREQIRTDPDAVRRRIAASIDRGVPVLACSPATEWSIVTGYDDGGSTLIGWDGSSGYWGPPTIEPDGYLANGMFATASWPEAVSRFVIVEGRTTPSTSSREVLRNLVKVMEGQRARGYDREFRALVQDDAYCSTADEATLRNLWGFVDGYVGWYAENRCFIGCAFGESLADMADVKASAAAVESLKRAAGTMGHTHDTCWEGWRALRATHKCGLPEDEPCRMCGGRLRPATEEDYEAFRLPERRRKLMALLRIVDENDQKLLAELRGCAELL